LFGRVRNWGDSGPAARSAGAAAFDPKPPCRDPLFDHLVGDCDQRRWHSEAERLRGLEVDDKFEPGHLLDRNVGRLRPTQNLVDRYWPRAGALMSYGANPSDVFRRSAEICLSTARLNMLPVRDRNVDLSLDASLRALLICRPIPAFTSRCPMRFAMPA
jgi:hypothetical protein